MAYYLINSISLYYNTSYTYIFMGKLYFSLLNFSEDLFWSLESKKFGFDPSIFLKKNE